MSIKKIKTTNSNTIARLVSLKGSVKNCLILECASYELSFFFFYHQDRQQNWDLMMMMIIIQLSITPPPNQIEKIGCSHNCPISHILSVSGVL